MKRLLCWLSGHRMAPSFRSPDENVDRCTRCGRTETTIVIGGRWKVQGEPPTRPGFKYQPMYFDSWKEAEKAAERLRRDGCFVPTPSREPTDSELHDDKASRVEGGGE